MISKWQSFGAVVFKNGARIGIARALGRRIIAGSGGCAAAATAAAATAAGARGGIAGGAIAADDCYVAAFDQLAVLALVHLAVGVLIAAAVDAVLRGSWRCGHGGAGQSGKKTGRCNGLFHGCGLHLE